mmetsp:Transcript_19806/g.28288  ORF Transcript_19806/g.28288 Transcript_19806/m.28288 type:complete len:168 (+) Transcript_19806:372-875(+)
MEQFRLKHKFDNTPLLKCFFADLNQVDNIHLETSPEGSIDCTNIIGTNKSPCCNVCHVDMTSSTTSTVSCKSCSMSWHLTCAARTMRSSSIIDTTHLIPVHFTCTCCGYSTSWTNMVRRSQKRKIGSLEVENNNDEELEDEEGEEEEELSCQSISSDSDDEYENAVK